MTSVLIVIPARTGSVRIPHKNLALLAGVPLITRTAADALDVHHLWSDVDVCISSDRPEVYQGAVDYSKIIPVHRPDAISGPTADISEAVRHATEIVEREKQRRYDLVVTLQPAVPARSPSLIRQAILAAAGCGGSAITMAKGVPWTWTCDEFGHAHNRWHPGPYPRSQDEPHHLQEVNAITVTQRDTVAAGRRWDLPLAILVLPPWATALDIDEPQDLATAERLWPVARPCLEAWTAEVLAARTLDIMA